MIACFDIGGTYIRYGLSNGRGAVPESGRTATPRDDFAAFVAALEDALGAMQAPVGAAVSISLAGFADPHDGAAVVANVPCLNGRRLAAELGHRLGRAVSVTNDADCFALAEALEGIGRGHRNVFAIVLGSGVGGGLVIEGKLVAGHGGVAGEWGHGPIVDPGAGGLVAPMERVKCGCGRMDCLDPVGSARGLERLHAMRTGVSLDSAGIVGAWMEGDAAAAHTVEIHVEHIARVLGLLVNVTGVSIVPVGGGLAGAPQLIAAIDSRVRALALAGHRSPLVVPGTQATTGGLTGAALAARQNGVQAA